MKAELMRAKSADELKEMVLVLRKEQMTMRFQKSGQQIEKTHTLKIARRSIARAKTLMNEMKNGVPVKAVKAPKAKAEKPAAEKKAPVKKAAKAAKE